MTRYCNIKTKMPRNKTRKAEEKQGYNETDIQVISNQECPRAHPMSPLLNRLGLPKTSYKKCSWWKTYMKMLFYEWNFKCFKKIFSPLVHQQNVENYFQRFKIIIDSCENRMNTKMVVMVKIPWHFIVF